MKIMRKGRIERLAGDKEATYLKSVGYEEVKTEKKTDAARKAAQDVGEKKKDKE